MSVKPGLALSIVTLGLGGLALFQLPAPEMALLAPDYRSDHPAIPPAAASPRLQDLALRWNLFSTHHQSSKTLSALTETLGAGLCVLDFNRDGWMDLYILGGSGHTRHYGARSWWHSESGNRLMQNHDGEYFTDITAPYGLQQSQWGMGCTAADLDNDGWVDLVTSGVGSVKLYRNEEGTGFEDVTAQSGIAQTGWSTGISPADYNGDGLLDLYISNYVVFEKGAPTFERNKGFNVGQVAFDAGLYDPQPNALYRNRGGFTFDNVSATSGITDSRGRSLGALWAFLNDDNWPDLLVINDIDSPNQVYLNQGGETFVAGGEEYALLQTPDSRDVEQGDFFGSGNSALLISRAAGSAPVLARATSNERRRYTDAAWPSELAAIERLSSSSWAATSGDFDNNGLLDVFIANGLTEPDIDSPFVPQAQPNTLLFQGQDGRFHTVPATPANTTVLSSRAAIAVDLDNDGALEIVLGNNNGPLQVLKPAPAPEGSWIGVEFVPEQGPQGRRSSIELRVGEKTLQRQLHHPLSFLGSGDPRLHIGLGAAQAPAQLSITRDRQTLHFTDLALNRYYRFDGKAETLTPLPESRHSSERFRTALAAFDDSARAQLGRLLLALESPAVNRELELLWHNSSPATRLILLQTAATQGAPATLQLVSSALDDPETDIRIAAIDILKALEFEHSVGWLSKQLASDDSEVACAAARTLQFFFEQEEAVSHRKQLAVPYLIRTLDTGDDAAVICAANALAPAENKRAALALQGVAESSRSGPVVAAALRALGLTRDTRAIATVQSALERADTGAHTAATALIALERLQPDSARNFLQKMLQIPTGDDNYSARQFGMVNSLLGDDEGIVLGRRYLEDTLAAMLRHQLAASTGRIADPSLEAQLLRAIWLTADSRHQDAARSALTSPDPQVRALAYAILLRDAPAGHRPLLRSLIDKEADSILLAVLGNARQLDLGESPGALAALANRIANSAELIASLPQILGALSQQTQDSLLSQLLRSGVRLASLVPLCTDDKLHVERQTGPALQRPALDYLYLYCSDDGSDSNARLADRLLLKQLLNADAFTLPQKQALLLRAAAADPVIAQTSLLPRLPALTTDERLAALEVFAQHPTNPEIRAVMENLLTAGDSPLSVRLAAARLLLQADQNRIISFVNEELQLHATD